MVLKDPLAGGRGRAGTWQACGVHHGGGGEPPPARPPRVIFPLFPDTFIFYNHHVRIW